MKKLIKSWKFWLFVCLGAVVLGFGTWGIVALCTHEPVPNTPTNLEVISTSTGQKIIRVSKTEHAVCYEFVITNTEANTTESKTISSNQFDATHFLEVPAVYKIKCLAINSENAKSAFCEEITHTSQIQLSTPTLTVGSGNTLNVHCTNALEANPNLVFTLFYVDGAEQKTSTSFTQDGADGCGTVWGHFNVADIIQKTGTFQLFVQVSSPNAHYSTSEFTSPINFTIE